MPLSFTESKKIPKVVSMGELCLTENIIAISKICIDVDLHG